MYYSFFTFIYMYAWEADERGLLAKDSRKGGLSFCYLFSWFHRQIDADGLFLLTGSLHERKKLEAETGMVAASEEVKSRLFAA